MDLNGLKTDLQKYGQEHLLKYWDALSEDEKGNLYKDVKSINLDEVTRYFGKCLQSMNAPAEKIDSLLQPIPKELSGSTVRTTPEQIKKYEEVGIRSVSENKVAVLLLAGGQGTRLGVSYPKGMYNVGLPSEKTLYQLQAERILRLQQLGTELTGKAGCVPWYIMSSQHTKAPTLDFFKKNNYFGLDSKNVTLFEQNTLPCMSFDGKIILEKPNKVARAPDGNGGLYRALRDSGVLDDIEKRGVEYVHVYCVDNILVKMADPVFLGFCVSKNANCGAKVCEKTEPKEAVGVVCKVNDHYQVVEYSEISLQTAEKRNAEGRLLFNAGNICNHFFTTKFLRSVCSEHEDELEHHVAKKKIPFVDESGNCVKPDSPNGIKMEKFVFDVFRFATNFAVWEVLREDEFSPLKNADSAGKDSPTTSRCDLYSLHHKYVLKAGGKFMHGDGSPMPDIPRPVRKDGTSGDGSQKSCEENNQPSLVEVSPLVSYAGEGLESLVKGKMFQTPLVIKLTNGQPTIESPMVKDA